MEQKCIPVLENDIYVCNEMVKQLYYFENIILKALKNLIVLTNDYQIVRDHFYSEYWLSVHVCMV
ncbi:hypothetical protein CCP3SC5AM1_2410002 [Gammaproteobacteria bacterium]